MSALNLDKEPLFCKVHERAAAIDLVLVHGAGADHRHWPASLAELPACNVYRLDLPGHGQSSGRGCTSVAEYADTVAAFIGRHRRQRVVLGGHSMGSAIVQQLALQRPDWLRGIVLVGAGARLKVSPALLEQLENDFPAAIATLCATLFSPAAPPKLVAAEQQRYLTVDWRLIRDDFLACNQFDVMERLGEIQVSTLVLTGDADVLTPLKYGQFLADHIVGAHLVVIPNAGHLPQLEQPDAFRQALAVFLQTLG